MSKGTIQRPGQQPSVSRPQRQPEAKGSEGPAKAPGTSTSAKLKDKKQAQKSDRAARPQVHRGPRPQRAHGAGGAHGAGAAHGADHEGEGEGHGAGGIGAADASDELHGRRHGELEWVREDETVEHHEELHDTGATGADAVKRSKGGDQQGGGNDGFDQGKGQREAYERYLKGNVSADK
ncbi:MAG: hypothetical protein IT382_16680, partial [Deltaproteobacteria bacterium]|nr:hypothetical protein [Deltaproteobacteria bacterium]